MKRNLKTFRVCDYVINNNFRYINSSDFFFPGLCKCIQNKRIEICYICLVLTKINHKKYNHRQNVFRQNRNKSVSKQQVTLENKNLPLIDSKTNNIRSFQSFCVVSLTFLLIFIFFVWISTFDFCQTTPFEQKL